MTSSTQLSFDFSQPAQLARVSSRIGLLVLAFFDTLAPDQEFHANDLRDYIGKKLDDYIAPGSPDRIMRQLRLDGKLNYIVVNRRGSLYRKA